MKKKKPRKKPAVRRAKVRGVRASKRYPKGGPGWEKVFLARLAETGLVAAGCEAAKVGQQTVRDHRKSDPTFAKAFEAAVLEYRDRIVPRILPQLVKLGIEGVARGIFYEGERIDEEIEYSVPALVALARAHLPEFRDKVHHTSDGSFAKAGAGEATQLVCSAPPPAGSVLPDVVVPGIDGEE